MTERLVPRFERSEKSEENIKTHLDLRLRFAEAVSQKMHIPLADALYEYTDLARRVLGRQAEYQEGSEAYRSEFTGIVASLEGQSKEHDVRLEALNRVFMEHYKSLPQRERPYEPFSYDYNTQTHTVHPHFGSMSYEKDSQSPRYLSEELREEIRSRLRGMFTEIKSIHPDAEWVEGQSWLYNDERYCSLFPKSYTADQKERKGGFMGGGRWGQFRQSDGSLNEARRKEFLQRISNLDPHDLERAFPLQTLIVRGPIADFYMEYGIE